jgi:alpha-tubulin suppressor-like RCC1 family protein
MLPIFGRNQPLVEADSNRLFNWGNNNGTDYRGRIGDNTTVDKSSPVQIGSEETWTAIQTGSKGWAGIRDGLLFTNGDNDLGQLGIGSTTDTSSPVQVGSNSDWKYFAQSNGGADQFMLAVNASGKLYSWGKNGKGELGQGDTTNRSTPTQVGALTDWAKVFVSGDLSMAIKTNGTLWALGV